MCQPYESTELCNAFFNKSTDYVYIPKLRGLTQAQMGKQLDSALPRSVLSMASDDCRDKVAKVLCNYYFTPCGTQDSQTAPVSVCPEECAYVALTCPEVWKLIRDTLTGETDLKVLECSNPSAILQPLLHCCGGFGNVDCECYQRFSLEYELCHLFCFHFSSIY